MSGKPSTEKVAFLREAAAELHRTQERITAVNAQISKLTHELEALNEVRRTRFKDVTSTLTQMDCAANHNTGWEQRITWMLGELVTQSEHYGRSHL